MSASISTIPDSPSAHGSVLTSKPSIDEPGSFTSDPFASATSRLVFLDLGESIRNPFFSPPLRAPGELKPMTEQQNFSYLARNQTNQEDTTPKENLTR